MFLFYCVYSQIEMGTGVIFMTFTTSVALSCVGYFSGWEGPAFLLQDHVLK